MAGRSLEIVTRSVNLQCVTKLRTFQAIFFNLTILLRGPSQTYIESRVLIFVTMADNVAQYLEVNIDWQLRTHEVETISDTYTRSSSGSDLAEACIAMYESAQGKRRRFSACSLTVLEVDRENGLSDPWYEPTISKEALVAKLEVSSKHLSISANLTTFRHVRYSLSPTPLSCG